MAPLPQLHRAAFRIGHRNVRDLHPGSTPSSRVARTFSTVYMPDMVTIPCGPRLPIIGRLFGGVSDA